MVSGLLQSMLGLLGGPGRLFLHCGPLVLAPSLVVAGLSAHREVAQFCSAHWGLALLYVSPERHRIVPSGVCGTRGGQSCWIYQNQQQSGQGQHLLDFQSKVFSLMHPVSLIVSLSLDVPHVPLYPFHGVFFARTLFMIFCPLPPPLPSLRILLPLFLKAASLF